MNAIVSGRSGRALLIEGDALKSFDVDDPSKIVVRKRTDLPYLFGDATDLRIIENTTTESVIRQLEADSNFTLALDLTVILLDAELPDDIRREAVAGLEDLLAENNTVAQLENVLYSRPLPEDADLEGALELCDAGISKLVLQLLHRWQGHQQSIAAADEAWQAIPSTIFEEHEHRKVFRRIAVKEGLFHTLATVDVSTFLLKAGLNQSIKQLPNYRRVLQEWSAPFRGSRKTIRIVSEDNEEDISPEEKRFERRDRVDRRAVLREALRKKSVIIEAMHRRDLPRVYELVDELVWYQQSNSESQHTAKSLCDLAMEAKTLDMNSLQLALTEKSISVAPGDGWSWAQYADALLRMQRFDDALHAYEQARAFGAGVVAKTGYADVLKIQGQFVAALRAYEEAISEHPENVVAKNGRAEVLKAQGQLAAALSAYEEVISQHPNDVVAKNGRAEVLKAQGQFAAALSAYKETIREHPENVVAKNGRAEVLKAQGQFDAALSAFEEVISQHPEDAVAKTGRAEVLKAQGQFDAALTAFEEVIREHPENVIAKTGRAEVFKGQGQFAAALTAFEAVIHEHPENVFAKNGRAEVLNAQGQFAAALSAYEEVISQHPEDVVAKTGRAQVLKSQGNFEAALTAYNEVLSQHPENAIARNGRSCVLGGLGRYQEALESLPQDAPIDVEDWIAYHIRGMILLRLGKVSEAIRVFNHGLQRSPFPSDKEYYRSALGLSWLRGRDFRKAAEALEQVSSTLLQPRANVIRIHIFGAQGERQRALQAYQDLARTPYLMTDELTQELHHQYVLGQSPTKDDEWIFDKEIRLFLRAA